LTNFNEDAIQQPVMPRKIRQLVSDLKKAGFELTSGGKGSHRKFATTGWLER
jgi:hypothetical protein